MAKTPSKTKTEAKPKNEVSNNKQVQAKIVKNVKNFKPNIRIANAIIGAIAFLQKSGIQASTRSIKTCIVERQRKNFQRSLTELPKYLSRGLELGILKKWNGGYKLGELKLRSRKPKRKPKRFGQTLEVIKAVTTESKSAGQSARSSVAAF